MEKELKKYMSNVDEVIALLKKKVERLEGEKKEAEQRADRYEKALIKIVSLSCVDSRNAILELKSIASMAVAKEQEALTPKTSTDALHKEP